MHTLETAASTSTAADGALVAAALGGRASAFELIMRRHNRLLFRAVRGVLDNDADAQDAVQEAWLNAFLRLGTFRGEARLATWLTRIALNVALDLRRSRRATATEPLVDQEVESADEALMPFSIPEHEAPEPAAQRAEMRVLLERAIDQLPPLYRSVFMLRAVQEMSVEDTARALDVSGDVVKTRFLRARALLRDAIGAQVEGQIPQTFAFDGARCDAVVAHVLAELTRRALLRPG
jgi:RNA polymerase sigma-70 factor (ECF subfamily)